MGNTINVAGYAKRELLNGNVEYRPWNPDVTSLFGDNDSSLTNNNFVIDTNLNPKKSKVFKQGSLSDFFTLDNIVEDNTSVLTIEKNVKSQLNLDLTNPLQYVWYGSFAEFNRVSLEDIQSRWPAAIYIDNKVGSVTGNSVTNYSYDVETNRSTFKINSKYFYNPFTIKYTTDSANVVEEEEVNNLRNLSLNYGSYGIEVKGRIYNITNFTGSTQITNSEVRIEAEGNIFNELTNSDGSISTTEGPLQFFIKPKETEIESFFTSLTEYQRNILNRNTQPIYKSTFDYPVDSETGIIVYQEKTVNFPLTKDGYNLNFFDGLYLSFLNKLNQIAVSFDNNQTNLIIRKYTAEVINSFDSIPRGDGDDYLNNGQKATNLLNIYGREFDEVKKYITGIKYAHVVSYDKKNNTPDVLVKDLANMLGFEGFALLEKLDINRIFLPSKGVEGYSGQTVLSTNKEVETEVYRRVILNIAWLWKSKGTRKAVEYLFRLIGAPESVVVFDEHVYVADKPIDVEKIKFYLGKYDVEYDESFFPFDSEGYPQPPLNTENLYYQSFGGWYRRTGGNSPGIDTTQGNNPHVGKYDGGGAYIRQFTDIIPRFSPETNIKETNVVVDNVFKNHNEGVFNGITNVNNLYLTLLEGRNNQILTNVVDVDFTLEENKYKQPGGTTTAEEQYNKAKIIYDRWTNDVDGILKNSPEKRYSPEWVIIERNYNLSLKKFADETNKGACGDDKCLSLTVTKKNILDEDYKKFRRVDFGPYIYYIDETGDKTYFEEFPERCVSDGGKFKTYENQQGRETVYCAKSAPCAHSKPIDIDKNNNVIFSVGGSNNSEVDSDNKQSNRTKVSSPECCTWYNYDYTINEDGNVYCVDNYGITESEVMDIDDEIEKLRLKKQRLELEINMVNSDVEGPKSFRDIKVLERDLKDIENKGSFRSSKTKKSKISKFSGNLKSLDSNVSNRQKSPNIVDIPIISLGGPQTDSIKRPIPNNNFNTLSGKQTDSIRRPIPNNNFNTLSGKQTSSVMSNQYSNVLNKQSIPNKKDTPTFNLNKPPVAKGPAGGSPSRAFGIQPSTPTKKKTKTNKENIKRGVDNKINLRNFSGNSPRRTGPSTYR